jgi:hypothetical protein
LAHHSGKRWTPQIIQSIKKILSDSVTLSQALGRISKEHKFPCTDSALDSAFKRAGEAPPRTFLKVLVDTAEPTEPIKRLFQLAKKGSKFAEVCDAMDLSPKRVKGLIEEAWRLGIPVKVAHNHVGVDFEVADDRIQNTQISPIVGKRQVVAVISDTHLGSKYCLRDQLKDFIHAAYEQGAREVLHPGDVLDGDYRHGKFEMSHMGIEEQTRDLYETLPKLPGLTYHCITGNHDWTFSEESGVNVGRYIANYFDSHGRNDIKFYGDRGAFVRLRGAVINLWHPRSGVSYARSYALQKHIEKYSSGEKPHIMLAGHWHVYCHVYERGVHALACPTFQGGGSAFGKSLGGAPAIGGLVLSWGVTKDGTLREFSNTYRAYFEKETPHRIDDRDSGIAIIKGGK